MASSFLNNGADDRLAWRRSDPPNADAAFSFLRQPLSSVQNTIQTPHTSAGPYENGNGSADARSHPHRRFTSSFASPFGYSRRGFEEPPVPDIPAAFKQAVSPGDKKKAEYEYLMQKKLERQRQFEQLTRDRDREELDLQRLQEELGFAGLNGAGAGTGSAPQSEPTTPPEYNDNNNSNGFVKKTNRFSTSNLLSSSTSIFGSRKPDSNALASPPNERARAYNALTGGSVPQSKQNSDEEEGYDDMLDFNHRGAALANRHSMPIPRREPSTRIGLTDSPSLLDQVNTHAFLFGDEDKQDSNRQVDEQAQPAKSRPVSYLHSNDEQGFPVLLRQQTSDLESSEPSSAQASKRSSFRRSLPPQSFAPQKGEDSPPYNYSSASSMMSSGQATPTKSASNRHSFGTPLNSTYQVPGKRQSFGQGIVSPPRGVGEAGPPKLQSSYSTNDIPTVKTTSTGTYANPSATTITTSSSATAEQRLHQHNASLGRIPNTATSSKRQSREFANGGEATTRGDDNIYSVLQSPTKNGANASSQASMQQAMSSTAPSAPSYSSVTAAPPMHAPAPPGVPGLNMFQQFPNAGVPAFAIPTTHGQQTQMAMLGNAMGGLNMGGGQPHWAQSATNGFGQQYPPSSFAANGTTQFPSYGGGRFSDPPPRNGHISRRGTAHSENSAASEATRFANVSLESIQGEIYSLCKDQHGCRYLQKKLEERNETHLTMIFEETKGHMVELMIDPFGNYLVQKLLEFTNDEQRTALIHNAASHMVRIALNQHGTRALQKMIEYVVTREQIDVLIKALEDHVVPMIQDLNGNHVIQKCLNRLRPEDVQFVINSVSDNCVIVGTHRHGCCVIQRCIDHATGPQKAQLIDAITGASFPLVQDAFGNYVLQYIFDQNEDIFSDALCRTFLGNIAMLSKQKFSSNVIEKCIRISNPVTRHDMIDEIIATPDFERLIDDAFANYVIQTAWSHADPEDEIRLAERVRPFMPRLRHKPHGRRFQTRILETEKRHPEMTMTHHNIDNASLHSKDQPVHHVNASQDSGYAGPFAGFGGYGGNNGVQNFSRPSTHRASNPPLPSFYNFAQHQNGYNVYAGMAQAVQNPWGAPRHNSQGNHGAQGQQGASGPPNPHSNY